VTAQVVAILVALAGGNKLSLRLDARKRQTELDLQALSSFYELYGQFFVHLERWNTLRAGVLTESRDHLWSCRGSEPGSRCRLAKTGRVCQGAS
jgi:hypothetical protein